MSNDIPDPMIPGNLDKLNAMHAKEEDPHRRKQLWAAIEKALRVNQRQPNTDTDIEYSSLKPDTMDS